MTASTTSAATPPKLLDTDLNLGKMEDDFGYMLASIGTGDNAPSQQPSHGQFTDSV